jgi:uncharacterized protein (TIGR00369 family)
VNRIEREIEAVETGAYARRLGLVVVATRDGEASVTLPIGPATLNRGGRVHGGAIASALLAAARIATAASEREGATRKVWCLDAHVSFLEVPGEKAVTAEARVEKRGRDLAHLSVVARDADGARVARAGVTAVLVEDESRFSGSRIEPAFGRAGAEAGAALEGSPYLTAAGVKLLDPEGGVARLRLPFASNGAVGPCRVDDGAIVGLIDSCAAFASYLDSGASIDRRGVTVSMSVQFLSPMPEDLIGSARVVASAADCRVAEVEVLGAASCAVAARGTAVYRIVGA